MFERGQKRRWRLDSARAQTAQTDAQYHDQIRQVYACRSGKTFTNMLLAKATLKLAQDNLRDYRRALRHQFQERYKAGDIGKLDFERLDLELAQFESDESNAVMKSGSGQRSVAGTLIGLPQPSSKL